MKNIAKILLLLTSICVVSSATCSCSNPKKAIKKTAYAYIDAMANYRVDDAEPYCTYETQITTLVTARQMVAAVGPAYIESDTPAKIKIKEIIITSDTTATVKYHKTTPIKNKNGELEMVLRDGKWLANVVLQGQLERIKHPENYDTDKKKEDDQIEIPTNVDGLKAYGRKKKDKESVKPKEKQEEKN